MPKTITQYNVFIGSPGGLEVERQKFRETLEKFSALHGSDKDVRFHSVGWEDTTGGAGRPQELINEDLRQCDFAVFVLYDRWGSPTGNGHTSGTAEEWTLAEELYKESKIRNIALLFKQVDKAKLDDPGDQLKEVLKFKQRIESEKRYFFKKYSDTEDFSRAIEEYLAAWLRKHRESEASLLLNGPSLAITTAPGSIVDSPGFDYWIAEARANAEDEKRDYAGAHFCALKAIDASKSDIEWADARNTWGVIQFHRGNIDEAVSAFAEIEDRFQDSIDADRRGWHAKALFNKGITLAQLGRNGDAILVFDNILVRFGATTEPLLQELVCEALLCKGVALSKLERSDDAIAVYDDVIARFGAATELSLRELVGKVLLNKGGRLRRVGRSDDAIAVYDDAIARFGAATELPLRELVGKALLAKGSGLRRAGRDDDAKAVYDDVIARFAAAPEQSLREHVKRASQSRPVLQ